MKTLNIDALAKVERTITLCGVLHEVKEMSVENFIETTRAAAKLESGNATIADQIEATIEMIQRSVPTITRETLSALALDQMVLISKFLRGSLDDKVAVVEPEKASDGKKKK